MVLLAFSVLAACVPTPGDDAGPSDATSGGDSPTETGCETTMWYTDLDGDGYGDPALGSAACVAPAGTVADATDCNDGRSDISPAAPETCDGMDDDCDGAYDEDAVDAPTVYVDADGDDHGNPETALTTCTVSVGYVLSADDCDDTNADVYPDAPEENCADPVDYNCDGSVATADLDADGWVACEDCDDTDAARNPSAPEVCDGAVDEDCDRLVDGDDPDATGGPNWYRDADGDGFGNDALVTTACDAPTGFAAVGGDCDDADSWRSPGLPEVCDTENLDEDCTGTADDLDVGTDAATFSTFGKDADGDGFGNASRVVIQCDIPAGYITDSSDCDDADELISPAATELCDEIDNDCDGLVDAGDPSIADAAVYYSDADRDGKGDPAVAILACSLPALCVENDDDCNDADGSLPDSSGSCTPVPDTGDTGDTGTGSGSGGGPIRFLVVGDAGDGGSGQYAVAAGMESVCATNGCDFVLYVGDNLYPGGATTTDDPLWSTNFELPYANLDLPFLAVMGNHDWDQGLDPAYLDAAVGYSALSSKFYLPADYYTFVEGDATFFALDTHAIDKGAGAPQETWLPPARARSTTTWNFVFGHHPYISNGPHGNADPYVEAFFDDHVCGQYDVYFAGHDHNLQWLEDTCGTAFIVSGAGHSTYSLIGSDPTYFEAAETGFLWAEIDGPTFTGVFYDADGVELFWQTIVK